MTPTERRAVIRDLSEVFILMTEDEADRLLRAAGALTTPAGWGAETDQIKQLAIGRRLTDEQDSTLEVLSDFLLKADRPLTDAKPVIHPPARIEPKSTPKGAIFVVHGHARNVLYEAVRVLERGTGREVIILHEQASAGRTILEKFEDYAANASFAVVLLTGDDEGGIRSSSDVRPRGRQNVIFELGFFFGKLGRDRVVVLHEGDIEKPSDISGLVYISLDQAGAWKQTLTRELEAVGISVDRARIP